MPRNITVTLNGKQINVKEHKIKDLKEQIIPKISGLFKMEEIAEKEANELIDLFSEKITEIFPDITIADLNEAYPSEIEALLEAWVSVNFTGLKKIYNPLMSLMQMGLRM